MSRVYPHRVTDSKPFGESSFGTTRDFRVRYLLFHSGAGSHGLARRPWKEPEFA